MHTFLFSSLLTAVLAVPAPAQGGGLDLSASSVLANQAVKTDTTPLVAGRSTFVRVRVDAQGSIPAGVSFDGVMRVYANGQELAGSPFYSDNGPIAPKANPSLSILDDTLNFIFIPPLSSNVEIVVEVNPPGPTRIAEASYANNVVSSGPLNFVCKAVPQCAFVPIDYRPGGGFTPNLPSWELIKPGAGDNFIQAIFPVSDWEYNRSDVPSKLWTSSVSTSSGGAKLAQSLAVDRLMMNPVPDFIYGWIPGGLPGYNGVALSVPGVAAIGNTDPVRHQRTFAHELGHLFGLGHNTSLINTVGIDVERHLNITESLPQLMPTWKRDIMYAGQVTSSAFVKPATYSFFANNSALSCFVDAADAQDDVRRLVVSGLYNRKDRTVELTDTVVILGGRESHFRPIEEADLILRVLAGEQVLAELGVSTRSSADGCPACRGDSDAQGVDTHLGGFAAALPSSIAPRMVERIEVVSARAGRVLASLDRSGAAPVAADFSVSGGTASWEASDPDGDSLTSYLRYSPDGVRIVPLASGLSASRAEFDTASLARPGAGGYFEVLVSDGLRTTSRRIPAAASAEDASGGNPPTVDVLSPDTGFSFPQGATVILHSSGWDIEDRSLTGASIAWSSDLDGGLGTGRVTSVADLSVGGHTLTATATDSAGTPTAASVSIVITARELPGGDFCQSDLGFGGPGSSLLEICGGDLSSGTTAEITLTNAAPQAPLWLVTGFNQNPTSLLGGTIVPLPAAVVVSGVTDVAGNWSYPGGIAGGGGLTVYAQVAYLDPALLLGISNAVRVEFLP